MDLIFLLQDHFLGLKRNKIAVYIAIIVFLICTMSGIILKLPLQIDTYFCNWCYKFIDDIYSDSYNAILTLIIDLLFSILACLPFLICYISVYFMPIYYIAIGIRGFIIGAIISSFIACFGLFGFIICLFLVVLPELIVITCAIVNLPSAISCGIEMKNCPSLCNLNGYVFDFILFGTGIVLSVILKLLLTLLIFRPIGMIFI